MHKNAIGNWMVKFVIFSLIIFAVLEIFEFMVFGDTLYFSSIIMGFVLPTAMIYSLLLGIVFATAQYVLMPGQVELKAISSSTRQAPRARPHSKKKSKRRKK